MSEVGSSPLDWIPYFGITRLTFGAAPGEQTIEVRYASESNGDTTKIRDARVLVIKADAADQFAAPMTCGRPPAPATRTRQR